jgi:hypothetical protein
MNHYRQQALGNIITALWLGAKVYLSERSIICTYLKRLNINVFTIETDLDISNTFCLQPLHSDLIEENRNILKKEYGKEAQQKHLEKLVATLNR